ncbi:HpcH/HpaI aldolase/citrate lyase family protein [Dactylosporangium aurantiacum]|uniref:HpcH/HpaI aldolase/citrate lyase family protein n=1 Tax=Dactylosporangium aurantiacum TaxID=35754 RepID=A0A9Q9IE64_9ACTN|nr:HpcH/HpaI aldolase/citrate lyase family protein [Dactylosporangium aurantiacum]MDG6101481.1 HpcH/HpaI aldolase/citrate lyase family protein [Dactylosporangium aurantiacum]UWZ52670.1 HpcH/HpaI aldolase/citrate lyase family protein [Dactylosporangium aurantiacum]
MRYFSHLVGVSDDELFHQLPTAFSQDSPPETLAMALGATLYSPAVRPRLAEDIVRCHAEGVMSMVGCLEDSIRDSEVPAAELNLADQLRLLARMDTGGPLVFVRVRNPEQIYRLADRLGDDLRILSGFVLPKFRPDASGLAGLKAVREVADGSGLPLYAMPVLETPEIAYQETRLSTLLAVRDMLDQNRDRVLAVRVGATDLSSIYALRRTAELTAWDVSVVATILTDIVNVLARRDGKGYEVTGPVWEYFSGGERVLKPQLRVTPFEDHDPMLRTKLVRQSLDGLIREIMLDKANGMVGKTVIHPSHAAAVHALSVVSHEEYCDAKAICEDYAGDGGGGVLRSVYMNKMNEVRPHLSWAERTLVRARIFGVAAEGLGFVDFLDAAVSREHVA